MWRFEYVFELPDDIKGSGTITFIVEVEADTEREAIKLANRAAHSVM